ncbi:MAG: EAL domain-containing protein [Spirochaetales bacterium]|nr:EAL domain-containing protein [Spirochaetales bacterium]
MFFDLDRAIAEGELVPFYQPQYNAMTNRIAGAEALARWVTGDKVVTPSEFLPELEEDERILRLDWYMLRRVCEFISGRLERKKKVVTIAVNFSRQHLKYELDFAEKVMDIVDEYCVPHSLIMVELTESALSAYADRIPLIFRRLRDENFMVAIDDFGSGLSSLGLIVEVDADVIKIDRSLISHNCESDRERVVLESIYSFAHRLRMRTVAEGVETKAQLGFLRSCNCDEVQGFLYAKPMPVDEFARKLDYDRRGRDDEDILKVQCEHDARTILFDAVMKRFPLIIFINLTRNSYYMMTYDNFTTRQCAASGAFDDCIRKGATTIIPEDREKFIKAFSRENLIAAYKEGKESVGVVFRQMGDDGIVRSVESIDFFLKNDANDDILAINFSSTVVE